MYIFTISIQEMQFKYPELFWALFLLLIPIFIHLFQLRRFKKTPFTNVKFLKKVVSESRQSNTLKKWLLLLTRMLLLAALVFAFSQPFFAEKSALKQKETVIYLDDSFSMQLKNEGTTLLENAVQDLIKKLPKTERFSLFTNTRTFRNTSLQDIQNELLALGFHNKQLKLNEVYLKGQTLFSSDPSTEKNLIVLSDFQQRMANGSAEKRPQLQLHLVRLGADVVANVAIDSAYISSETSENLTLSVDLSSTGQNESVPVSLFNGEKLAAKTSASFDASPKVTVSFSLPKNEVFNGKIEINDSGLSYDNRLFFNIGEREKIKVLSVGNPKNDFLKRIYTEDEFTYTAFELKNLNYSTLSTQHLIVLNDLPQIPTSLTTSLKAFIANGGHLTIIPAVGIDMGSYNLLTSNYATTFVQPLRDEREITDISFSHPLYQNVFEKNVTNFQYPKASECYQIETSTPTALGFQGSTPFLVGDASFFLFTASLEPENSNFTQSPLVVPTFYNMAMGSLKLPPLYAVLGESTTIDIATTLAPDHILKLTKPDFEFIPQQRSLAHKVSLFFNGDLQEDGIYAVMEDQKTTKNISFNHNRNESKLAYLNTEQLESDLSASSIASLFDTIEKDNSVTELWKWFVILALLLLFVEVLIQKYLK
ncbi:N-terminal double-transmembrane domain-containing protein [Zobellia uliginosa]|uniref:N-terminal double-transmembrane domain-containing protein n=1 Tax=Zobellia uliginosa TaxID=143224 RepID=A0ABY1KT16_9FLAO|nr:BatA domain-containing protein [Zobellia uliginosa]SIS57166.1 N-terminal double-transmembrane domain-containing protein [Zobellia uliginosa]